MNTLDFYKNHYQTLFTGTKLKLLLFNEQVETMFHMRLISYDTFLKQN